MLCIRAEPNSTIYNIYITSISSIETFCILFHEHKIGMATANFNTRWTWIKYWPVSKCIAADARRPFVKCTTKMYQQQLGEFWCDCERRTSTCYAHIQHTEYYIFIENNIKASALLKWAKIHKIRAFAMLEGRECLRFICRVDRTLCVLSSYVPYRSNTQQHTQRICVWIIHRKFQYFPFHYLYLTNKFCT